MIKDLKKLLDNKQVRFVLASILAVLLVLLTDGSFDSSSIDPVDARITELNSVYVTDVVDGDTIKVLTKDDEALTVRLIGVDTPESKHPNKEVECFALEAASYLEVMVLEDYVDLELDSSQGEYDKYGRLLAYVWDGENLINAELIENGFGFEYTYDSPYKYQTEFKQLEKDAKYNNKGLWGNCSVA